MLMFWNQRLLWNIKLSSNQLKKHKGRCQKQANSGCTTQKSEQGKLMNLGQKTNKSDIKKDIKIDLGKCILIFGAKSITHTRCFGVLWVQFFTCNILSDRLSCHPRPLLHTCIANLSRDPLKNLSFVILQICSQPLLNNEPNYYDN